MYDFKTVAELGLGSFGMAINMLLMVAIYRANIPRRWLNLQLVIPAAVVDFLGSLVLFLKTILLINNQLTSPWVCPYLGASLLILPCLTTVLVSTTALDRYAIVVHSRGIPHRWGWLCISITCCSFTATVLVNTIVYDIIHDSTASYCKPIGSDLLASIIRHYSALIVFVGLFIITFSYLGIHLHCRKTLATFHALPDRYLIIPISYFVCLVPKAIRNIWDLFSEAPPLLLETEHMGLMLLFLLNPCLVFGFQSRLRKEVLHIFLPRPTNGQTSTTSESKPSINQSSTPP
ncbi:hypothetical protein DSO57_1025183 [Entomophthora muscae]|uniref:Uncharacterized protein n=1 Tax=Entomophthora muscae TaxID=34485 RepID=A0ACC2TDI0_9FUNG|nr:hypothetical protein DSO57_1025183 [Entomophthora muscae]